MLKLSKHIKIEIKNKVVDIPLKKGISLASKWVEKFIGYSFGMKQ